MTVKFAIAASQAILWANFIDGLMVEYFLRFVGNAALRNICAMIFAAILANTASPAFAESHLFDEIRVMPNLDVGNADRREPGAFVNAMLFLDPLDSSHAVDGMELMMRPRIHLGGNFSTEGQTSQLFGGLSWKIPLNDTFYVDFGLGGTMHNGATPNLGSGPDLGCPLLFREYAGIGYQVDEHWSLTATIDHSSHAGLCSGKPNQGITHAGLALGYKF